MTAKFDWVTEITAEYIRKTPATKTKATTFWIKIIASIWFCYSVCSVWFSLIYKHIVQHNEKEKRQLNETKDFNIIAYSNTTQDIYIRTYNKANVLCVYQFEFIFVYICVFVRFFSSFYRVWRVCVLNVEMHNYTN